MDILMAGYVLLFSPTLVAMLLRPKSLSVGDGHEVCTRLFSFENKNLLPLGGPKTLVEKIKHVS
jgi:hypothetical protein